MRNNPRAVMVAATFAVLLAAPDAGRAQGAAYIRGMELEQAERFREAAVAYREVLDASPANVPALLGLERVYALLGWTDSLLPVLDKAIAAQPTEAPFRAAQLRSYRALGRHDDVRAAFERWRRDWPRDPMPYREYARILIQDGQAQAADTVLRRAQAELGSGRGLELELAQLRATMGLWHQSAESWRAAVGTSPYLEQAAVFALAPAPAASRAAIRRVLIAPPAAVGARRVAAALQLLWGAPQDAWNVLRDLPPDTLAVAAWMDFARRAEEAGEWLAARDALVAVLGRHRSGELAARAASAALNGGDPRSALALANVGGSASSNGAAMPLLVVRVRALAALGRADEAQRVVDAEGRGLAPEERARLDQVVAWAWVRSGNIDKARATLAQSGTEAGGEARGWLALYEGDLRGARKQLKRTGNAAPQLLDALALLARTTAESAPQAGRAFLALAQGDTLGAAAGFEKAARSLPDAASLLLATAARLRAARREDGRAVALWKTIAESHTDTPEAPEANLEWARALRRTGQHAAAIARLEHLILTYPQSALVPQARRELELARAAVPPTS